MIKRRNELLEKFDLERPEPEKLNLDGHFLVERNVETNTIGNVWYFSWYK